MMVISNKRAAAFSLLAFVVFLHPLHGCAIGANQTSRRRSPAIIIFGDSIVDPGNNNVILTTIKCNFPPYGKDFVGHKATGRFSNGKIPSDIIASQLGIKEYVPAYLGTELSAYDLITGVSFASGGCGFDPLTSQLVVSFIYFLLEKMVPQEDEDASSSASPAHVNEDSVCPSASPARVNEDSCGLALPRKRRKTLVVPGNPCCSWKRRRRKTRLLAEIKPLPADFKYERIHDKT